MVDLKEGKKVSNNKNSAISLIKFYRSKIRVYQIKILKLMRENKISNGDLEGHYEDNN